MSNGQVPPLPGSRRHAPGSCPGGNRAIDNKSAIASTASPPEPDARVFACEAARAATLLLRTRQIARSRLRTLPVADRVSNSASDLEWGGRMCPLARETACSCENVLARRREGTACAHQNASAARATVRTDDELRQPHSLAVAPAATALSSSAARQHGQLSRPRRPRPVTVSATSASSCPTRLHTLGRATTLAVRSARLSWQSPLAGGASAGTSAGVASPCGWLQSSGRGSRFRAVGFRRGRGGGDCGFIINRPVAARARSWRWLRRGAGCPAVVAPGH